MVDDFQELRVCFLILIVCPAVAWYLADCNCAAGERDTDSLDSDTLPSCCAILSVLQDTVHARVFMSLLHLSLHCHRFVDVSVFNMLWIEMKLFEAKPNYTVSQKKTSPFLYLWQDIQMSPNFANFWAETYPWEFETNTFTPPTAPRIICLYVCTVPCKN